MRRTGPGRLGIGGLWLLAACASSSGSSAATPPDARSYARWALLSSTSIIAPGHFSLAGRQVSCGAAPTVTNPHLDDVAAAFERFIVVNPRRLARLPQAVQLWAYAHECGHIRFGADEARSDSAAVDDGVAQGWLAPSGLDQICDYIKTVRGDSRHGGDDARCRAMRVRFAGDTASIGGYASW